MGTADNRGWTKSSLSSPNGNCIELQRQDDGSIKMREGEQPNDVIVTSKANLAAFLEGAKAGDFDFLVG